MPKKGENIYRRKDGRWEGRYIRFYDESGKEKYPRHRCGRWSLLCEQSD